jgi:hypothetical protein
MEDAMATRPHDVSDLYLAPVVLEVDARIEELGKLQASELAYDVALETNRLGDTRAKREAALLETITRRVDCHGWDVRWDPRGLRLSHSSHSLVLGIPAVFTEYLSQPTR